MKERKLFKRILSAMLIFALVATSLGNYQLAEAAGPASGPGSVVEVSDWDGFMNALKGNAETIKLTGDVTQKARPNTSDPLMINRDVIIDGEKGNNERNYVLSTQYCGILLGGNVTFKNLAIEIVGTKRNGIIANGYNLTVENIKNKDAKEGLKGELESYKLNIVAGYLEQYQQSQDDKQLQTQAERSSSHSSTIEIKGENQLAGVFAGSLSDADKKEQVLDNSYANNVNFKIDTKTNNKIEYGLYASGCWEPRDGSNVHPFLADAGKFKTTGNVTFDIYNSPNMNIVGDTGSQKNAVLNYHQKNGIPDGDFNISIGMLNFEEINVLSGMFEPQPSNLIFNGGSYVGNALKQGGNLSVAENSMLSIRKNKGSKDSDGSIGNISGKGTIVVGRDDNQPGKYQFITVNGTIDDNMKVDVKKDSLNSGGQAIGLTDDEIVVGGPIFNAVNSNENTFILNSELYGESFKLEKYADQGFEGLWRIVKNTELPPVQEAKLTSFSIPEKEKNKVCALSDFNKGVPVDVSVIMQTNPEYADLGTVVLRYYTKSSLSISMDGNATTNIKDGIAKDNYTKIKFEQSGDQANEPFIRMKILDSENLIKEPQKITVEITAPIEGKKAVTETITLDLTGDSSVGPTPGKPEIKEKQNVEINLGNVQAENAEYSNTAVKGYTGEPTADGVSRFDIKYSGTLADGHNTQYGPTTDMPTKAGSYTVTFDVPEDNPTHKCEAPKSIEFDITKKELQYDVREIKVSKKFDNTTDAAVVEGTLDVTGIVSRDDVKFQYINLSHDGFNNVDVHQESDDLNVNTPHLTGEDAYNYTITKTAPKINASITKADAKTLTKSVNLKANETSLRVEGLADLMADAIISNYELGQVVNNTNTKVTDAKVQDGVLTATIADATENDEITFPVTVTSNNYENSTINVVLTITKADEPTPEQPTPTPGTGGGAGGGAGGGGGAVTPEQKPEQPEVPEVKPDVQTPILPVEPPKEGANVGMSDQQKADTDKTLGDIIADIIKPEVKPDSEKPGEKPEPSKTEAEKETAATADKIVEATKDKDVTIKVDVKADKIVEDKAPEKVKKEINEIKKTVEQKFEKVTTEFLQFVNIDVVAKAEKDGATTELGNLRNLDRELEFSFVIPDDKIGKKMVVVRFHDGVAEIIPSESVGNKVIFKTNKFSTYALVEYDEIVKPEPPVDPDKPDIENPDVEKPVKSEKPAKVQKVTVKTDNGLLKVTFNKVAKADKYKVYVKQVGNKGGWRWIGTKNNSLMIKKLYKKALVKNGKYQVKVVAVNENGEGVASQVKTVYANRIGTKSAKMPVPKIEKIKTTKGAATVYAKKIKFKTAPKNVSYRFAYRAKGSNKWHYTNYTTKNVKKISSLKRGKTYTFAVNYRYKSQLDSKTFVNSSSAYRTVKVR